MSVVIDHTVLPAHNYEASAQFFAQVIGFTYEGPDRHFAPVRVNETFSVVFTNAEQVQTIHLGFHVSEAAFQTALHNLQLMGHSYGSLPWEPDNMRTDHPFGGNGLYFVDPNGHLFELMTHRHP